MHNQSGHQAPPACITGFLHEYCLARLLPFVSDCDGDKRGGTFLTNLFFFPPSFP